MEGAGLRNGDLGSVVVALTVAGVEHRIETRADTSVVVVATRVGTDNWVEITRHGDDAYLASGFIGGIADPNDATILAIGPLAEIPGVAAAWLGHR